MKKTLLVILSIILSLTMLISFTGCSEKQPDKPIEDLEKPVVVDTKEDDEEVDDETGATPKSDPIPLTEPEEAPEGTVLSIYGDGVEKQTNYTLEDLMDMKEGYRELKYSTTNNWPSFKHMSGNGISLIYLLKEAGILDTAKSLVFISTDGYQAILPKEQVFSVQYSYSEHSVNGSSGENEIEPIIAWEWGDDKTYPENMRPIFGQVGPYEVNTASSVKDLYRIEVLTWDAGSWAVPTASIEQGNVSAGTELELGHPQMDNIKIYYTLDGTEPSYNSEVYNKSTTYFQPDLIVPLIIENDVTIKAFVGGLGKADSAVVEFTYKVG